MAKYEFDDDFQVKVAALALRDPTFCIRTDGLIEPSYFASETLAVLVDIAGKFWNKYKTVPSLTSLMTLIKHAISKKIIRSDMVDDVKDVVKSLMKADVSDRDYVVDEVAEFARHQAIIAAMEKSVDYLDRRDFEAIDVAMSKALRVAANEDNDGHDFGAELAARTERRKDVASGKIIPTISSGFRVMDDALPGGGFARKELAVLLGPAKRGKSFGLMNFAVNAFLAGRNVLMVTLENSIEITTDRMDAYVSSSKTNDILDNIIDVETAVEAKIAKTNGCLKLHEYATGSFAPKDLKRLIERYRSKGVIFDMIVVDYWDIMAPDMRYRDDKISESASIGVGLRAIAKEENAAVVTAVQSNREGYKAHTATADTVAEDFNKVRLADVFFSINADEDEKAAGEARIYMAAVRNKESGVTLNIKQDLSTATFISGVLGRGGI